MTFFKKFDWKLTIIIILLVIVETLAQTSCEQAASLVKNNKYFFISAGIFLYGLVGYLYYLALQQKISLAIANIIWQISTIIIVTLVSVFFFKQPISKKEIIGIVIVIIGCLFFLPDNKNLKKK